MEILGVKIDNLNRKEILDKIEVFLQEDKFHQIATVNPEFILQARKDRGFMDILNGCDLNVADGVGIWFAFLRFGGYLKGRMAGIDLMEVILKIADEKKVPIFLVSYDGALSSWESTKIAILKKYPNLDIKGASLEDRNQKYQMPITDCGILFCNLGSPYQEKFLNSLGNDPENKIRLAIGVGGSFDFLTSRIKRAPECIRMAGLEWLWRFSQEPIYRAKRILRAVMIFPIRVLFNK